MPAGPELEELESDPVVALTELVEAGAPVVTGGRGAPVVAVGTVVALQYS